MKKTLTSKMRSQPQEYCTHRFTEGKHDVVHYSAPFHTVFLAFVTQTLHVQQSRILNLARHSVSQELCPFCSEGFTQAAAVFSVG